MPKAKITDKDKGIEKAQVLMIPLGEIHEEAGFNPRVDYGDIEELARSIYQSGQQQPLTVRKNAEDKKWYLVDGHRRMRAFPIANKLGASIKNAMCLVERAGANRESRVIDLFSKNSGKPLTPIEQAEAVKRLITYNWNQPEIAKSIGKPVHYVTNLLKLSSADQDLQKAVIDGDISFTAAVKLSAAPKAKQTQVLAKITDIQKDPAPVKKDGKPVDKAAAKKAAAKRRKVSVAAVEKALKGETAMISTKSVKDLMEKVNGRIAAFADGDTEDRLPWVGAKYSLEILLGKKDFDTDNFSEKG